MPKAGKSKHKSAIRIRSSGSSKTGARRVLSSARKRQNESRRATTEINRELDAIAAEYQRKLSKLIGRPGILELDKIRSSRAKATRAQKQRRALSVLKGHGVRPADILELRRPYRGKISELLTPGSDFFPVRIPHFACDGPSVRYSAPYAGYYWSYQWDYSSNSRVPLVEPYVDLAAGGLGSGLRTSAPRPDDSDSTYAEILTAFYVWHTPQATGPLEITVSLEFPQEASDFSGNVIDEFGWSECNHSQYARVLTRATDSQNPAQSDTALLLSENFTDYHDYEGDDWNYKFPKANEIRTYRLTTAATFGEASNVLIEAGIQHVALFRTNDMRVYTNAHLNVRLLGIEVRSCTAPPIPRRKKSRNS